VARIDEDVMQETLFQTDRHERPAAQGPDLASVVGGHG
jgi:hypothetical protein